MSLFSNSYSGLITNGLGSDSPVGMMMASFTMFGISGEIIEPPAPPVVTPLANSSGGGFRGFRRPDDDEVPKRIFRISAHLKGTKNWHRDYEMSERTAKLAIRSIKVANSFTTSIKIGAASVSQKVKRVTAAITQFNK